MIFLRGIAFGISLFISTQVFAGSFQLTSTNKTTVIEFKDITQAELKDVISELEINIDNSFLETGMDENKLISATIEIKDKSSNSKKDDHDPECSVTIEVKESGSSTSVSAGGSATVARGEGSIKHDTPNSDIKIVYSGSDCSRAAVEILRELRASRSKP